MTALEHALTLARLGLSVIPVPRPDGRHDGKVPAVAWREYQARQPTEAELRRWFACDSNLAIVTGAVSGVVVVDLDSEPARQWWIRRRPYTPWQTRTAKGYHLFFRHRSGRTGSSWGWSQ